MTEITFIIDALTGDLLVENPDQLRPEILGEITALFGAGREMGCARPLAVLPPPVASAEEVAASSCVRVAGYYHNSLIEGPGRRSSVLFRSCPLACKGCWVENLHDPDSGALVPVDILAAALLDPNYERDGVSILGGEPFAQPDGLSALVRRLRARGCPHILCYSGYTFEALQSRALQQPVVGAVLNQLDVLIDGPYVESLSMSAGPWTGSGNQRVIDLTATRRDGRVILLC